MENYRKVFNADIATFKRTEKTFRDIFEIMFSHESHLAYEVLENYEITGATYGELRTRIADFAAHINREHPDAVNEFIGIDLPNGPDFLTTFWAVLQSGNKPYLVNSYYPSDLNERLLKRIGARIVITSKSDRALHAATVQVASQQDAATGNASTVGDADLCVPHPVRIYADFAIIDPAAPTAAPASPATQTARQWADEIAISSSLTGLEAKICVFDGKAVANQILNAPGIIKQNDWLMHGYNGKIKLIAVLPLFHVFGLIVTYFWFAFFGRTIVFLQNHAPDTIRSTINRHQVTHVIAPPILFNKLHKGIMNSVSQESEKRKRRFNRALKITYAIQNIIPDWGTSLTKWMFKEVIGAAFGKSVRFMITGGAFIDKDVLKLINNIGYPLFNGYGTTETAITGANFKKKIKHRTTGSIGAPFDSVKYSIDDKQTLSVSGESICKRIITFDSEQTGFASIQTNDIIRIENGQYYVEGRLSDLYIGANGENISPDIIESGLKVKNANNLSVLELDGKLAIVLEYNSALPDFVIDKEVGSIKRELATIPFGLAVNDIYITRDRISNENSVKTSRALLRRKIASGEVRLQNHAPATKPDRNAAAASPPQYDAAGISTIKELFQRALDTTDDIDIHANFFLDLHGTSLDYFTLINDIASVFNVQINLEQRNNLYTISDIYKYLMEVL